MKTSLIRIGTAALALLMAVSLCGCEMDVAVATLPQGGTVTTASGAGDAWDGSGTVATTERSYATTATVQRDESYANEYGIYHTMKGYCFGEVYTVERWLPMLGYIKDGVIVDTMYTSTTIMPSPKNIYWGDFDTKEEWDAWREHTYKNLATLNEATEAVGKALNLKDHKTRVFLTLANPHESAATYANWGSLNGVKMDATDNEHRFTMLKYMIDSYIAEYNAKDFEHIDFVGFYWFDEYVVEADLDWYNRVTDYIRSRGKITMISPYYKSNGWDLCDEAGFDLHSMQSNYFPNRPIGEGNCGSDRRLTANAAVINSGQVGGIEVEGGASTKDQITGVKKTMKVCVESGIVNGYHVYYFDEGPFWCYRTAMSSDPYFRSCYDELYRYMHNVLTVEELWIDPIEKEQSIPDGAIDWI